MHAHPRTDSYGKQRESQRRGYLVYGRTLLGCLAKK